MRLITYVDFKNMASRDAYYRPTRWPYFSVVLELVRQIEFNSVLELGAYKLPLVIGSDTMDIRAEVNPTYRHDACVTPWPIPKAKYDLFIALQVWEHLGTHQVEAFAEVKRIARKAILSFPLRWNRPKDKIHHGITESQISTWTHHVEPERRVVVRSGNLDRLICQFDLSDRLGIRH